MQLPDRPPTGAGIPTNRRAGSLVLLGLNGCDLGGGTWT
jgi:hypothetical protein